jgi:hypothetical protein
MGSSACLALVIIVMSIWQNISQPREEESIVQFIWRLSPSLPTVVAEAQSSHVGETLKSS